MLFLNQILSVIEILDSVFTRAYAVRVIRVITRAELRQFSALRPGQCFPAILPRVSLRVVFSDRFSVVRYQPVFIRRIVSVSDRRLSAHPLLRDVSAALQGRGYPRLRFNYSTICNYLL